MINPSQVFKVAAPFAAALLFSSHGHAADLGGAPPQAAYQEVYSQPYRFSWSGAYLGVSAGYARGMTDLGADATGTANFATATSRGAAGSVTAGYNVMLGPSFLVGIEGDLGIMNRMAGDQTLADGRAWHSELGAFWGTLRGRAGLALDRLLVYGTGGLAVIGAKDRLTDGGIVSEAAGMRAGWVLSAGVEYAFAPRFTTKIEYLHMDFTNTMASGGGDYFDSKVDMVRAGINFRF